jgi:hypothetical protein
MKRATKGEAEMRWLDENEAYLEENFAGKWVAVNKNGFVAAGDTFSDAANAARALGTPDALIAPVKSKEYQGVYLIR